MEFHLNDFAHLVDGDDWTLALQEALHHCKLHPGSTLHLDGGTKHFRKKYTAEHEYLINTNDFAPGHKYIVFHIIGFDGLTIDGDGADLFFHGTINPFVIDHSNDVTLRNFNVDYEHPFYLQGKIVDADEHHCEVEYDTSVYEITLGTDSITFGWKADDWTYKVERMLTTEFDAETGTPYPYHPDYFVCFPEHPEDDSLSGMNRYMKASLPAPGRLLLKGEIGFKPKEGNILVSTWNWRYNPGVFATDSRNFVLRDVNLYHTAAMGFIGQLCHNITMERFNTVVRPGSGRCMSVCADSTHFVCCSGTIRFESCRFLNMMDDAGNIHGLYMPYVRTIDDHTLLVKFKHPGQAGLNPFSPGDKVEIVDTRIMQPVTELTVKSSELFNVNLVRLELEEKVPPMREEYVVDNITKMPEVYINNCETGDNRPIGFRLRSRKHTEVTNSLFHNMAFGLLVSGDTYWGNESGPSKDVVIRHNRFVNAAYAMGSAICISTNPDVGGHPYHSNILIEDNYFEQQDKRFLDACSATNLVFRNNTYHLNPNLPAKGRTGEDGVLVQDCPNAQIEPAKEV